VGGNHRDPRSNEHDATNGVGLTARRLCACSAVARRYPFAERNERETGQPVRIQVSH